VAKVLLKHGADTRKHDSDGFTALMFACAFGHTRAAGVLLDWRGGGEAVDAAEPNRRQTALHMAAQEGHVEVRVPHGMCSVTLCSLSTSPATWLCMSGMRLCMGSVANYVSPVHKSRNPESAVRSEV
jgi:ankyrin repeat protein